MDTFQTIFSSRSRIRMCSFRHREVKPIARHRPLSAVRLLLHITHQPVMPVAAHSTGHHRVPYPNPQIAPFLRQSASMVSSISTVNSLRIWVAEFEPAAGASCNEGSLLVEAYVQYKGNVSQSQRFSSRIEADLQTNHVMWGRLCGRDSLR